MRPYQFGSGLQQSGQQDNAREQAKITLADLDRDAFSFVLGALAERAPQDVLAAVQLYQTVLGRQR